MQTRTKEVVRKELNAVLNWLDNHDPHDCPENFHSDGELTPVEAAERWNAKVLKCRELQRELESMN